MCFLHAWMHGVCVFTVLYALYCLSVNGEKNDDDMYKLQKLYNFNRKEK